MMRVLVVLMLLTGLVLGQNYPFSLSGGGATATGIIAIAPNGDASIGGVMATPTGGLVTFKEAKPCIVDDEWGTWFCIVIFDGPYTYWLWLGWAPESEIEGWFTKIGAPTPPVGGPPIYLK